MKHLKLLILLPHLILSRDPFVWPTQNVCDKKTMHDYQLLGTMFNSTTQEYTAQLSYHQEILCVQRNDALPNQMIVKNITLDHLELVGTAGNIIINWENN